MDELPKYEEKKLTPEEIKTRIESFHIRCYRCCCIPRTYHPTVNITETGSYFIRVKDVFVSLLIHRNGYTFELQIPDRFGKEIIIIRRDGLELELGLSNAWAFLELSFCDLVLNHM